MLPVVTAALQQPQPHDVFEQPERAAHAAFIREIQFLRLFVNDRLGDFRPQGSKVVYDIKLSDLVRQTVERSGGQAIMERSGHAFIKRTMIEQDGLFGCEASGHYFFRELRGGDDGLFAALLMTDLLKRRGVPLAELRRVLPPIYVTPDLRIPAEILSFAEITGRLRSAFKSARETSVDGIRLETHLGYVLARESVTEPVVTMRLDGFSEKSLSRLIGACLEALPEVSDAIVDQVH